MTAERSRQTAAWFAAHPRLKAGVVAANRWLPLIPFACYPALLIWLGLKLAAGQTQLLPAAVRAAQSRGGGRQPLAASDPFCVLPRPADLAGAETGCRPDPASARSGPGGAGAGSGVSGRHSPAPGTQLPPPLPAARFRAAGAETAAGLLLSFPPCTERRCHCSGVAVFQPRRRGCADGRCPGHLRASGADPLSAGVIAAVRLYFSPAAGAALTVVALVICGLRVLTGVHFVRDVAAGVILGFALGLAGMWLL